MLFVHGALDLTNWFDFVLLASVLVERTNTADLVSVLRHYLTLIRVRKIVKAVIAVGVSIVVKFEVKLLVISEARCAETLLESRPAASISP